MRKTLAVAALLCAVGCSAEKPDAAPEPEPSKAAVSAETFDREALRHEEWETSAETYTAALKLKICNAGSEESIAKFLASDDMPFVVDDPEYDAKQWAKYCASK
ncbi:hypothetical protein [Streptomyces fumanus]|uniref:hypothetical protein n=1 Tax=Streptomyces fumanus TaxID=67302 RepID=UPI0033E31F50